MMLQLIGINHKTAPVEVRERLAIPESRLPEAHQHLARHPGIQEGLIISTCNRVELLTSAPGEAVVDLRGFLHEYFHVNPSDFEPHLYEFREKEAIRHLFRVASSLDSMVVGEPQILGQVKDAYTIARGVGSVQGNLDPLISRAFAVAKKVRTETAVGSSSVSIASVAVELAKKIFGSLRGKSVYLIGAGKMIELAARHLVSHGASTILVSNRTYDRAVEIAQKFNGKAIRFDDLYDNVDRADIVISSTGAPHAIFRREHGEKFLSRRKNKPMFFIDIAVPRDVDPELNDLEGIFVYDIDDLQQAVSSHLADRGKEAERAERIVDFEVDAYLLRQRTRDVVPMIVSLQDQFETIRQAEIDRARGRLGKLSPDQEQALDALTQGIVKKILHMPISTLKTAARDPQATSVQATTVSELVRRMFKLDDHKDDHKSEDTDPKPPGTNSGSGSNSGDAS